MKKQSLFNALGRNSATLARWAGSPRRPSRFTDAADAPGRFGTPPGGAWGRAGGTPRDPLGSHRERYRRPAAGECSAFDGIRLDGPADP